MSLDLSYCPVITDRSIKLIAASHHRKTLSSLNIEMCKRISNILLSPFPVMLFACVVPKKKSLAILK